MKDMGKILSPMFTQPLQMII